MSENLTKLAQKIDFSKPLTDDIQSEGLTEEEQSEDGTADAVATASTNLPWEAIATKIR